ncbi:S26 family signal peptidase [Photobacterium leiognathi]|uniref:S26 family signal peptidase n=1 Tax=Photobacterium leiognathi TaxID=553611 RepID=UPI00273A57D8|nr:S26 family signal peptidase [Photobacterium leiognathi]
MPKSGDTVDINKNGIFVNGLEFRDRKFGLTEKLKISEESLYKTIQLRDNEIFFAGTADNSFDSVYWGVGNTSQIIAKAIPLW